MISAITGRGKLRFHFYRGNMTQEKFQNFLMHIMKRTERKVFAVSDNLTAHIGLDLKEWAGKNAGKIELFYLPYYSPHLNLAEYLNNNLKYEIVRKGYAKTKKEIENNAMNIMRSIGAKKTRVASFFDNDDVKYTKLADN